MKFSNENREIIINLYCITFLFSFSSKSVTFFSVNDWKTEQQRKNNLSLPKNFNIKIKHSWIPNSMYVYPKKNTTQPKLQNQKCWRCPLKTKHGVSRPKMKRLKINTSTDGSDRNNRYKDRCNRRNSNTNHKNDENNPLDIPSAKLYMFLKLDFLTACFVLLDFMR